MAKIVVLCCILLPVACQGGCVPGEATCNVMDEAALVQKDLLLAQKGVQPAADIDRATVAKHISEALSLQHLSKSNEAKLELVTRLFDFFKPMSEEVLAATSKYKDSKHSPEDFDAWNDAVSGGFSRLVGMVDGESKAAEEESLKAMEKLDGSFDNLEEAFDYGDKLTNFAVANQRSSQIGMISNSLKEQSDNVQNAMEEYDKKANGGFVDKKFGKAVQVINTAFMTIRSQLEIYTTINKQKLDQVNDAKSKYTIRPEKEVSGGMWRLIALDKAKSRAEVAHHVHSFFEPLGGEYEKAIQTFSESKRELPDRKALRSDIDSIIESTESMLTSLNEADKKGEKEMKDAVSASFSNLADEGEFAQKLMKFATHWGRQRLETDLLTSLRVEQANVKNAFDEYEKASEPEKAFGQMYSQLIRSLITMKSTFVQWEQVSDMKEHEMVKGQHFLNHWLKQ